jgi:hypothetical protein
MKSDFVFTLLLKICSVSEAASFVKKKFHAMIEFIKNGRFELSAPETEHISKRA